MFLRKIELFTLAFAFVALHCFVDIKKTYDFIYKYRVWRCIGLLAFAVLNNFNVSSLGMCKPAATKIQELIEENPDAKWVSTNFIYSQFLIANGAPTVTSTNYIPNMELWEEFDPDGSDEEIYNRYAHLNLALIDDGESYYELVQADMINLVVTKDDFDKLDADFLVTVAPIDEYWSEDFELEYQGENILIYRLNKTNLTYFLK